MPRNPQHNELASNLMGSTKWAGAMWLVAALLGLIVTIIFRADRTQWVVTIVACLGVALVGALTLWRSIRPICSGLASVTWLVIYA